MLNEYGAFKMPFPSFSLFVCGVHTASYLMHDGGESWCKASGSSLSSI